MSRAPAPHGWAIVGLLALAAALTPTVLAQSPSPGSADWVARQIHDRDTGRDSRLDIQMRMFDKQGRVRERHLRLAGLRGTEKGERADRLLIRFLFPNDIKGTGFLVLGASRRRRRTVPLPAGAWPRPPDRRRGKAGQLCRLRLHLRRHRRPRAHRLRLRHRRCRRLVDRSDRARRGLPGGSSRAQRTPLRLILAWSPPC